MKIRNKKGQWVKGLKPWNRGTKGVMKANKTSFKPGDNKVDLNKRFWEKVEKTETCWNWLAGVNKAGYGRVNVNRKAVLAHRISYEMKFGLIPKGKHALHKCDNPKCVNPDHLWIGDQVANNKDRDFKGRAVLGENRSQAKLTNAQADEIRLLNKTWNYSHRKLAKMYKVSSAAIFNIIHRKTYYVGGNSSQG